MEHVEDKSAKLERVGSYARDQKYYNTFINLVRVLTSAKLNRRKMWVILNTVNIIIIININNLFEILNAV